MRTITKMIGYRSTMTTMITIEKPPSLESFKVITNEEYRGIMMNGENDKRLEPVKTMTMKELKLLRISA